MAAYVGSKRQRTGATFIPSESAFEDTEINGTLDVTGDATFGDATDSVVISDAQIQFREASSVWSYIQRSNQLTPGNGSASDDLLIATDGGVWIQSDKNDNTISGNKAFAIQYRTDGSSIRLFDVDNRGWIIIPQRTTDPSSAIDGSLYYNTTTKEFKFYTGTLWVTLYGEGTSMPFMQYFPQNVAPVSSDGRVYYDDGTNTSSGLNGLRIYRQDEADWSDIPVYKQGSFTPIIGDGTNNFTMSSQVGRYVRIGNYVHGEVQVVWTSKGSASGSLVLQGFPFTRFASFSAQFGDVWRINLSGGLPANTRVELRQVNTGSENINLVFVNLSTDTVTNIADTDLDASGNFFATFNWITDDTFPTN